MDVKVQFFLESDYLFLMLFFFLSWFQKVKFQDAFYPPPVVVVSPRLGYNNNNSRFSGSAPCNLVTAWVEVRKYSLRILPVVLIGRICLKLKKCCFYRCPYTHVKNLDFSNDVQRGMESE